MSKKYWVTDHLFPQTNLITGMGSIFNVGGNYFTFNTSDSEEEADARAIESDWGVISLDLKKTMLDNPKETIETHCL